MQLNTSIKPSQVNSCEQYLRKKTYATNKGMYAYADSLFFEGTIKAPVLHTFKAIISCSHISSPTHKQINEARTRSASRKFAQGDPISLPTLGRHIRLLEDLKLVNIYRYRDKSRNSRNAYTIRAPEESLSCPSDIKVIASISSSVKIYEHNVQFFNSRTELPVSEETQLIKKLVSIGMFWWLAKKLIKDFGYETVNSETNYVMSNNKITNKGAYLRRTLLNIHAVKPEKLNAQDVIMQHRGTPAFIQAQWQLEAAGMKEPQFDLYEQPKDFFADVNTYETQLALMILKMKGKK